MRLRGKAPRESEIDGAELFSNQGEQRSLDAEKEGRRINVCRSLFSIFMSSLARDGSDTTISIADLEKEERRNSGAHRKLEESKSKTAR